jgi:hypothetical protein
MKYYVIVLLLSGSLLHADEWTMQTSGQTLDAVSLISVDQWNLTVEYESEVKEVPLAEIFWLRPVHLSSRPSGNRTLLGAGVLTGAVLAMALFSDQESLSGSELALAGVLSGTAGLGLGVLIYERRKGDETVYLAGLPQGEKTRQLEEIIADAALQSN